MKPPTVAASAPVSAARARVQARRASKASSARLSSTSAAWADPPASGGRRMSKTLRLLSAKGGWRVLVSKMT